MTHVTNVFHKSVSFNRVMSSLCDVISECYPCNSLQNMGIIKQSAYFFRRSITKDWEYLNYPKTASLTELSMSITCSHLVMFTCYYKEYGLFTFCNENA